VAAVPLWLLAERAGADDAVRPPLVKAGVDLRVGLGERACLEGAVTGTPGPGAAWSWSVEREPAPGAAGLTGADGPDVCFRGYSSGDYVLALVVSAGGRDSEPARVTIHVTQNLAPTALASGDVSEGVAPLSVVLDASRSSDPEGEPLTFDWAFGDGSPHSAQPIAPHVFERPGEYSVQVAIRDSAGHGSTTSLVIRVTAPDELRLAPQSLDPAVGRRLFVACAADVAGWCPFDYLRQELSYFDIVRDETLADVQVRITRVATDSGGFHYALQSWRRAAPAEIERRGVEAAPGLSPALTREALKQEILRALYGTLRETQLGEDFELALAPRSADDLSHLSDPWNYWVLALELGAQGEGESLYHAGDVKFAFNARRITADHRTLLRLSSEYRYGRYDLEDGQRITGHASGASLRALQAWSVGKHWAAGALATLRRSEYDNLALHAHAGPALEVNLCDYADNATRQVRFVYQVGGWASRYLQPTVAGKDDDLLAYQALSAVVALNQNWGDVQLIGQASDFLSRPERYRVAANLSTSLNLFEGFALGLEGSLARISDQISLPRTPATEGEVVLGTRELPKSFDYGYELRLSYTFGSVHNTIVNPRFGQVDEQDD
jgi:PKD repeat protein